MIEKLKLIENLDVLSIVSYLLVRLWMFKQFAIEIFVDFRQKEIIDTLDNQV
jgi:hypothetical protein